MENDSILPLCFKRSKSSGSYAAHMELILHRIQSHDHELEESDVYTVGFRIHHSLSFEWPCGSFRDK